MQCRHLNCCVAVEDRATVLMRLFAKLPRKKGILIFAPAGLTYSRVGGPVNCEALEILPIR